MGLASHAFKTEFAVDMTCQSCVGAVKNALKDIDGIDRYDIELENKRVVITGKTPPSRLLAALKSTERQVLVRGASAADTSVPSEAAVSVIESPLPLSLPDEKPLKSLPGMNEEEHTQKVFGIARFLQIAPESVFVDLTVRLPPASRSPFSIYVSSSGNLVNPPATTGRQFVPLGTVTPDKDGYADLFKEVDGKLWEWIGRACVVNEEKNDKEGKGAPGSIFAGIVARSAGAWGNDKTICACSGRTMWEEGREMQAKGML